MISYGTGVRVETLDDLDWKILNAIKDNCRLSALSLGQKFKVTYKTIQNRLKKLQEKKIIIGHRIFLKDDKKRFGFKLISNSYTFISGMLWQKFHS